MLIICIFKIKVNQNFYIGLFQMRFDDPKILNSNQSETGQVTGITITRNGIRVNKPGIGTEITSGIIRGLRGYLFQQLDGVNRIVSPVLHFSKVTLFKLITIKKVLSKLFNRAIKIQWHIVQICLLFLCCIVLLNFYYYPPKIYRQQLNQLDDLHRNMLLIKKISQVEWERSNCVKKIIKIINQFNPEMDSSLKTRIANEVYQMTIRHGNLDIELICATITHESAKTWNPEIVSHANAIGLMQIMPSTGSHLAQEDSLEFGRIEDILFDPILNIRLGCRYLSTLIAAYEVDGGLAAYNGGMKRAEIWLQNGRAKGILHEETDKYVPSILKLYADYRQR